MDKVDEDCLLPAQKSRVSPLKASASDWVPHQQVIRFPFVLDTPYFARVQALSSRPEDNLQEEFVSLSRAEVIGILSKCWLNYWTLDSFLGSPAGNLRTTFLPQYSADFRCQGEVTKGPLQRDTWKRSFSHVGIGRWGYQWASWAVGSSSTTWVWGLVYLPHKLDPGSDSGPGHQRLTWIVVLEVLSFIAGSIVWIFWITNTNTLLHRDVCFTWLCAALQQSPAFF